MVGLIILQAYMHSCRGLAGEHINATLSKLRGSMVVRALLSHCLGGQGKRKSLLAEALLFSPVYFSASVSLIFFSAVPFSTYPLSLCSSLVSRPVDSRRETDISHLISCCVSCSDKLELVPLERYFLEDATTTLQYHSPTSPCLAHTSMWRSRTYQYAD